MQSPHDEPQPNIWLQWKASDIFAEIVCVCGQDGQLSGYHCYYARCGNCGRTFELDGHVKARVLHKAGASAVLKTGAVQLFGPVNGTTES